MLDISYKAIIYQWIPLISSAVIGVGFILLAYSCALPTARL